MANLQLAWRYLAPYVRTKWRGLPDEPPHFYYA